MVLTDIKMPYMDGLTFGAQLLKRSPATKLIVLTGFDEFEYAKEAIRLNVMEYVLKPVNVEELTRVLMRVKETLNREFAQKRDVESLRSAYDKTLPLVRDQYLREVLTGAVPQEDVAQLFSHYAIEIDIEKPMIVTVFDVNVELPSQSVISKDLLPISVRGLIDDALKDRCTYATFLNFFSVVTVSAWDKDPVGSMMGAGNEICAECRALFGAEVTAGIGRRCNDPSQLRESLLEAREAVEYKRVVGAGKAIYIRDVERMRRDPVAFDARCEQRLVSAIKFGTQEQIAAEIQDLLGRTKDLAPTDWKYRGYALGIVNAIFQIVGRYDLPADEVLGKDGDWEACVASSLPIDALAQRLTAICRRMGGYMSRRRKSMAQNLVEQAKDYIHGNYSNSNLSVETVCEQLHISQSYFSNIFKQDTGRSFVQYLTDIRMETATALLRETDDKTYVIAERVGYEEANYFSYVFKKRYGMSPSQYRGGRT